MNWSFNDLSLLRQGVQMFVSMCELLWIQFAGAPAAAEVVGRF